MNNKKKEESKQKLNWTLTGKWTSAWEVCDLRLECNSWRCEDMIWWTKDCRSFKIGKLLVDTFCSLSKWSTVGSSKTVEGISESGRANSSTKEQSVSSSFSFPVWFERQFCHSSKWAIWSLLGWVAGACKAVTCFVAVISPRYELEEYKS